MYPGVKSFSADERDSLPPPTSHVRLELYEPSAVDVFHARKLARLRYALKPERSLPARPEVLFVLAADYASNVEAPDGRAFVEAQCRERDRNLNRVARLIYAPC